MSSQITKDADIFFVLHEVCHCLIEDDKVNTLIASLIWGTASKLPTLNDISEHEILADRLATIFKFSHLLTTRNSDYYERLKKLWKNNIGDEEIEKLKKQDMGLKLVGIECGLFIQLILEKFLGIDNPYYLKFSDRVNWNRKFLFDVYGLSEDVFLMPDSTIGFMMELLDEVKLK
jgi:hypothetical protein